MSRVCILLPSHWGAAKGGAELQAHGFADYLARNTNHTILYLSKHSPAATDRYRYRLQKIDGPYPQRFGMFWDASSLMRALSSFMPDVILQRVACAYTGVAAFYSRRHGAKLVWHVSSDRDVSNTPLVPVGGIARFVDQAMFKFGVRNANAVVTQTKDQARILAQNYCRDADAVIPNFAVPPTKAWKKSDRFTVLWIANLKPLKQPEVLLRLASDLAQLDISFKVIGRRSENPWCDSILDLISRSANVKYLGELEIDEVNSYLEQSHLLVNTSLFEGLPNTFIQAWLREVPTLTLGVDPDGMISSSKLGYCASTYEALRSQLLDYYNDRNALSEMGASTRAFAMEKFSMKNARALSNLVENLLQLT